MGATLPLLKSSDVVAGLVMERLGYAKQMLTYDRWAEALDALDEARKILLRHLGGGAYKLNE